eukprot:3315182-Rhodomonas_salina.1
MESRSTSSSVSSAYRTIAEAKAQSGLFAVVIYCGGRVRLLRWSSFHDGGGRAVVLSAICPATGGCVSPEG